VSTPKYDEDLALEELPLEADLPSHELFTKERVDFEKCEEEDKSENLIEEDCSHEPHHLIGKLKVSEDMIVAAIKHFEDTHTLVADCCWRASGSHDSLGGEPPLVDFQALREAVVVMKSNYLHLLSDRDHLLMLGEMYHDALKGKEEEVDRLTQELEITQDSLKSSQKALQESEMQVEHLCVELSWVHPSSSTLDS
jgi:hypothetical protein